MATTTYTDDNCYMPGKVLTFPELLAAAAKSIPDLWSQEGQLNTTAVARYCEKKGFKVSQATLHRHFYGDPKKPRKLDEKTIKAISAVFGVPPSMLRGEPMAADTEKLLTDVKLSTILLAKKLEELPERTRRVIENQIEEAREQQELLKQAQEGNTNITSIDKARR